VNLAWSRACYKCSYVYVPHLEQVTMSGDLEMDTKDKLRLCHREADKCHGL